MLAEIGHSNAVNERACRLREHDLAPVSGCSDSCGEVHVVADVPLVGDERRPV